VSIVDKEFEPRQTASYVGTRKDEAVAKPVGSGRYASGQKIESDVLPSYNESDNADMILIVVRGCSPIRFRDKVDLLLINTLLATEKQ
jgi:hypothetical protein